MTQLKKFKYFCFIILFLSQSIFAGPLMDAFKFFYMVSHAERRVLERFGKFKSLLNPGLNFKWPFIERSRTTVWSYPTRGSGKGRYTIKQDRVDIREDVYPIPQQGVITKDNVVMEIDARVYWRITDASKAVYGVQDLPWAIESLTQTTLRNLIGGKHLDETLTSRDAINTQLCTILNSAAAEWGVEVTRVELQKVDPPDDIRKSMEREMSAERNRRAVILDAEGAKSALILRAEGEKESKIRMAEGEKASAVLRADGEASARYKLAEAEAQSIERLRHAAPDQPVLAYLVATKYISSLPEMIKNGQTILFPYDASSLASAVAMARGVFEGMDKKEKIDEKK